MSATEPRAVPALARRRSTSGDPLTALPVMTVMKLMDGRPRLRLGQDARWFEIAGERVVLARRRSPRLILMALVEAHRAGATSLSTAELLAAGWPGELVQHEAGRNRVYTAVKTLRRLGIGELLLRYDDGYLLDPSVQIVEETHTV